MCIRNYIKPCLFLHTSFTKIIKIVKKFVKNIRFGKYSFIEKAYVFGNCFESNANLVSCPLSLSINNMSKLERGQRSGIDTIKHHT